MRNNGMRSGKNKSLTCCFKISSSEEVYFGLKFSLFLLLELIHYSVADKVNFHFSFLLVKSCYEVDLWFVAELVLSDFD